MSYFLVLQFIFSLHWQSSFFLSCPPAGQVFFGVHAGWWQERRKKDQGLPRRKQISSKKKPFNLWDISFWAQQLLLDGNVLGSEWKCPWKIECFLEDLFLGSQWSIILGYRRLSVKSLKHNPQEPLEPWGESHEGYEGSWDCVCGFYR